MTVGDMTSEYSISLDNTPADVTLGTLHHDDGVLFFAPADGGDGYSYEWYVDGEPVKGVSGPSLDLETLGLADGVYRVDVVVDNGSYGSMNSYSLVVLLEAQSVYSTIGADEVCHISPILIEDEPAVARVLLRPENLKGEQPQGAAEIERVGKVQHIGVRQSAAQPVAEQYLICRRTLQKLFHLIPVPCRSAQPTRVERTILCPRPRAVYKFCPPCRTWCRRTRRRACTDIFQAG